MAQRGRRSSRGRSSNTPERDEQGRFTSDDDDRGQSSSRRSSGQERERDEEGKFVKSR